MQVHCDGEGRFALLSVLYRETPPEDKGRMIYDEHGQIGESGRAAASTFFGLGQKRFLIFSVLAVFVVFCHRRLRLPDCRLPSQYLSGALATVIFLAWPLAGNLVAMDRCSFATFPFVPPLPLSFSVSSAHWKIAIPPFVGQMTMRRSISSSVVLRHPCQDASILSSISGVSQQSRIVRWTDKRAVSQLGLLHVEVPHTIARVAKHSQAILCILLSQMVKAFVDHGQQVTFNFSLIYSIKLQNTMQRIE